jgi:Flp pilus assembly pilin Flp
VKAVLTRFNRKSRAQSTAEYAILIGLVIAAAVAMQVYVKRTLQGRMRGAVHYLANYTASENAALGLGNTTQYEPYYQVSNFQVTRDSNASQNLTIGGVYCAEETATTSRAAGGFQAYQNVQQE